MRSRMWGKKVMSIRGEEVEGGRDACDSWVPVCDDMSLVSRGCKDAVRDVQSEVEGKVLGRESWRDMELREEGDSGIVGRWRNVVLGVCKCRSRRPVLRQQGGSEGG